MSSTKVYILTNKSAAKLHTTFCGIDIELNFRNSVSPNGQQTSSLITSESFVQDAIENDARFGSLIRLANTYGNETQARNAVQQKRTFTVIDEPTIEANEAAAQHAAEEEASAKKRETIRKKRLQAKAAKEAQERQANIKDIVKTEESGKIVFDNINDALSYFLEKGEDVTDINMPVLLEQYNATIKSE